MEANAKLPSRDQFLKDNLDVIATCDICQEPFTAEHPPARIRTSKECQHIFGATCLRHWLESDAENANTCPVCRAVLFRKVRKPNFTGSTWRSYSEVWVENLATWVERKNFARCLWAALWELYHGQAITDTDIEETVNEALIDTSMDGGDRGLYIRSEHWPAMKTLSKEMVNAHYENGVYKVMSAEELKDKWMPKLAQALGWRVEDIPNEYPDDTDMDE